jgi:hypothetical protein
MLWKRLFKVHKRRVIEGVYDWRFGRFKKIISPKILPEIKANDLISNLLRSNDPFFVGRLGFVECEI